ncbi:MAG: hypothetical protein CL866_07870 [Cycloclasticus sp.]|nr:hypothetical protein [Cycloclasticus sp.]MBG96764.1 hypothetical protein [Cycloclasticus sp.]HAI96273.1 hypothetical protein [Methylococcaceae bacterium]|tara:strand:+ start:1860 stop:2606 length:747 start_codon:yes stop_codon:yes gene_type:complete
MTKNMDNRRQDKRLQLPNLQIKVKKPGIGEGRHYVNCKPIDISWNGLAFSSDTESFELLQKIEIQLSVGHKNLEGSAVICHVEKKKTVTNYGVLYIDIAPTLEQVFSTEELSSNLVESLAVNMADRAVIGSVALEQDIRIKKGQIILFDAIQAFKLRINSLVGHVSDGSSKKYQMDSLFEFSADTLSVTVPCIQAKDGALSKRTITPTLKQTDDKVVFSASDGEQYESILDVLQSLSDTFKVLLSEQV